MRDGAEMRGADLACIFLQRTRKRRQSPARRPCRAPALEFGGVDQEIDPARSRVDAHPLAVADERDRPACHRLRRYVADAHAAGGAGEAAIGDERHLLPHALSINESGRPQHLAHPRTALRPLIADHQDLAFAVSAGADHRRAFFFALEHAGRSFVHKAGKPRELEERAVGRNVALEHDHAACWRDGPVGGVDDMPVRRRRAGARLRQSHAGNGRRVAVQVPLREQCLDDGGHASDRLHVLRIKLPARLQIADQRRALEHRADIVKSKADARLVCEGRNVKRGIGRAAGCRDNGAGVFEAGAGYQIARQRTAAAQDLHDQRARLPSNGLPCRIDRCQHCRARRCEPKHFRHHAHGIGGELPRARSDAGHAGTLDLVEFRFGHLPRHDGAGGFVRSEHRDRFAAPAAHQRAPAEDEDRRYVAADHRHYDAGEILVAAAEADESVIGVRPHDELHGIGNHLARYQRAFHALMVHADAVGHRDCRKRARRAAGFPHARMRMRGLLREIARARRRLTGGGHDADEGPCNGLIVEAHGAHEHAMGCTIDAIGSDARAQLGCAAHLASRYGAVATMPSQ